MRLNYLLALLSLGAAAVAAPVAGESSMYFFYANLIRHYLIKFTLQALRFPREVAVEAGEVDAAGVKAQALASVKAAARAMEAEQVPVLEQVKALALAPVKATARAMAAEQAAEQVAASAAAAVVVRVAASVLGVASVPDLALVVELD